MSVASVSRPLTRSHASYGAIEDRTYTIPNFGLFRNRNLCGVLHQFGALDGTPHDLKWKKAKGKSQKCFTVFRSRPKGEPQFYPLPFYLCVILLPYECGG